jgi:hypothetical protein
LQQEEFFRDQRARYVCTTPENIICSEREKYENVPEKAKKPHKVYISASSIMVKDLWREVC